MTELNDDDRRYAFGLWLRTGYLPTLSTADDVEMKFNPWHDPGNGRFTFANTGRYHGGWTGGGFTGGGGGRFGGGGASAHYVWPDPSPRSRRSRPHPLSSNTEAGKASGRTNIAPLSGTRDSHGRTQSGANASARTRREANATAPAVEPVRRSDAGKAPSGARRVPDEQYRTVLRNGYTYRIDGQGRTRRVSGALTLAETPVRSRTAQRQAGGTDRLSGDDGGHYIAARFDGPTEAFNHFAQDSRFNRGRYRALEDQWARAKHEGKRVAVKIIPMFDEASTRPATIGVMWVTNGIKRSVSFTNTPSEHRNEKR